MNEKNGIDILPHEKQIFDYVKTIEHLKQHNESNTLFVSEIKKLEEKLTKLKKQVYSQLSPWERVLICRHPQRPHSIDYIENVFDSFFELHGDRCHGDDTALIGGLAKLGDTSFVVIGQEKGKDTESRVHRNFGMLHPEGFRKALRLMKLAEKFQLPMVSFLDTPGAMPVLEAEERGQGWAIATNLREMASLATPIVVVIIGEGFSGGALGVGVGDIIGMLEHACYSVISPEGCASILWKDPGKKIEAASALKMNVEDLLKLGIVDSLIKEPLGGAHHDPQLAYQSVKNYLVKQVQILKKIPTDLLLEQRYLKYRKMGSIAQEKKK